MTKVVWGACIRVGLVAALAVPSASCGSALLDGQASSYLIITALEAAPGADPTSYSGMLISDVITIVDDVPTIYNDVGRVEFQLAMKDVGPSGVPTTPTSNNYITVDRYRVTYLRTDGRNTPGVDVPHSFDSAVTLTVTGKESVGFMLVRTQAKQEPPLRALRDNGLLLSMIAEVTFYGRDQTGRSVSVTGRIGVNFGNFADPK